MRRPWIRELLTLIALLAATGVAFASVLRERQAVQIAQLAAAGHARAQVHDRLMGTRLDLSGLDPRWGMPPGGTFAWLLDVESCQGCFDTVADWVHLEQLDDHDFVVFVGGPVTAAVEARLRALDRTRVVYTTSATLREAVGFVLPNTKLLLDGSGVVLLVDSRYSGQECGWSFEAQAGMLRGVYPVRPIRADGVQ